MSRCMNSTASDVRGALMCRRLELALVEKEIAACEFASLKLEFVICQHITSLAVLCCLKEMCC